ncbi:MAG: hypothetical protein Q4B52_03710 [Tissierellia bacterium]|nr:hypothetical protein [Tissierellia bacterium]
MQDRNNSEQIQIYLRLTYDEYKEILKQFEESGERFKSEFYRKKLLSKPIEPRLDKQVEQIIETYIQKKALLILKLSKALDTNL